MNPGPKSSPAQPAESQGDGRAQRQSWGSFRLLAMVGRGSFGEVYRAWDPRLEREVGLKLLLPRSAGDEEQFQTLLREARALAAVRHPNIVPVHGIDQHDGLVGFWTDFVHGKTLAALVREQGPFGYREAVLAGIDVCKALSAVHRAGLLHRDIKAENVMREEGGRILLMDFGLSALPHRQKDFAGTPLYMAPELFEGAPSTVASDIYAVGVLLFFLVTGKHPAGYTTSASGNVEPTAIGSDERTSDVASDPRRSPVKVWARSTVLDHRPDLPEHFARAVETATDPDPARRFPSAGAISSALSALLVEQPADSPAAPGRRSKKWLPYLVALGILLLAAAGFAYLRTSRAAPNSKSTAALNEQYLRAEALLQRSDKRQNVTDATAMLKEILAKDPQFALAQAGLGHAYFSQYRESRAPELLDQARTACNRAIEIEPNLAPPYITLARIGAMAGNTALATQEIQRAIELDPHNPEAYGAQSEIFDAEGRGGDAIASVQRAIDLAPGYWRWPLLLGSYDFAAGKLNEATEQFRKATELTPDNAIAFLDLGLAQLQLERFDEARASLEKSAQLEPSFSAFSALGELLSMQGKFPDAVEMYSKARDLNPGDYIAWGNLASGYLWNPGSHDQAMVAYAKAIELAEATRKQTPEDALLLAALGGYYAVVGKPSLSPPLLRQAVALQPDDPDVLFRAGEGYEIIHQRDPAIRLVARSIALGYHVSELNRSPELASLRADPKFQQALRAARAKDSLDKANQSR